MTVPARRPTRRAVLVGLAVAVTGCRSARGARAAGPDDAALLAAWQSESQLLAAYAGTAPQHRVHVAHLRALEAQLRRTPSPSPTESPSSLPSGPDEQATVAALQAAATAAHDGENAALLASIAASHAVLAAESR